MKVYVVTDLEGVAGVSRWEQAGRDGNNPSKQQAMRLLTAEVNAAVDGILAAAPSAEVVVWDGHGNGGIDVESFHPAAKLLARGPIRPPYCLDSSFDALFFVGQHAMAGTPGANLCHTYSSRTIEYYRLNGIAMGELGCRVALAGELGVPLVFVSGDDRAVAEARALVPEVVGVAVKESLGLELALHLSPRLARERIAAGAAEAVRRAGGSAPLRLTSPYELEVCWLVGCEPPRVLPPGAQQTAPRTVLYRAAHTWELPL